MKLQNAFCFIFVLSAALLPVTNVQGKIGETRHSIEARLGFPPMREITPDQSLYQRGGFMVLVTYENGVSVAEEISKSVTFSKQASAYEEAVHASPGGGLSKDEIKAILDVYGDGKEWHPGAEFSLRSDGKVTAAYHRERSDIPMVLDEEDKRALRETPCLFIADTAYLAVLRNKSNAHANQREQADSQRIQKQVQSVFGPAVPVQSH